MRRQSAQDSARQLAWLADARGRARARSWREREVQRAHGRVAGARFAVLGYGSLGGEELGFGSDLDLVFLYDARAGCAVRRRASAGCVALVRAAGAEGRRAARHGDRRRAPVRRRRAPASGRRQGPAGVEPGQLRRLPARARVDLGAPGAGARARRRRRCGADRRFRSACARETLARAARCRRRCATR